MQRSEVPPDLFTVNFSGMGGRGKIFTWPDCNRAKLEEPQDFCGGWHAFRVRRMLKSPPHSHQAPGDTHAAAALECLAKNSEADSREISTHLALFSNQPTCGGFLAGR